jgi:predicted 2-oxoglutarate/Fe(II)-dependent dioxygenase YbiX
MNNLLKENNYIIIPNFISSYKAKILYDEYLSYCESESPPGDAQSPRSNSNYNYISFLEMLCEKTQEVSSILEEKVLPTYAYSRIYHNKSVLEKHTDRDSCEISLTLHLGGDDSWPIYIQTPNGEEKSVILHPGDAMMYLGKVAEHWRNEFTGNKYAQVFLHYVRSRGDCSYSYFDKDRNSQKSNSLIPESNHIKEQEEKEETCSNKSPLLIVSKPTNTLEQYIHVFDDIIPSGLCGEILEEYLNSHEWQSTLVGSGVIDKNVRNCSQISISSSEVMSKNYEKRKSIDDNIHNCIKKSIDEYIKYHKDFSISIDTGYQLLKYEKGEFYTEHTDSFTHQQRSLSCSLQLNEDYTGGEFGFFDREMLIKSKKGSVIIFPSNFMYPHEILPVIDGTRYSIITWLV